MKKIRIILLLCLLVGMNVQETKAQEENGFMHIEDLNEYTREFYSGYTRTGNWLLYMDDATKVYQSNATSSSVVCTLPQGVVRGKRRIQNWIQLDGTCNDGWVLSSENQVYVVEEEKINEILILEGKREIYEEPFATSLYATNNYLTKGSYKITKRAFDWVFVESYGWINPQYPNYTFAGGVQARFQDTLETLHVNELTVQGKNIPIHQQIISVREHARPGVAMVPQYVTIHTTGNYAVGSDARAHANMQSTNTGRWASWHYSVDESSIYQSIPLNEVAYHSGDGLSLGNASTISIEIAENSDGNYVQAELNAAYLTARILYDNNLPANAVKSHRDWSGKDCPKPLLNNLKGSMGWNNFLKKVEEIYYSFGNERFIHKEGFTYYQKNGMNHTKWLKHENKWYYFSEEGIMFTGWHYIGSSWYYFSNNGIMAENTTIDGYKIGSNGAANNRVKSKDGWELENNKWIYTKDGGKVQGWLEDGNRWFYLSKINGAMFTGIQRINNQQYYFLSNGQLSTTSTNEYQINEQGVVTPLITYGTGWTKIDNQKVYFVDGKRHTSWLKEGNTWYYFLENGFMATGWHEIGSSMFYFYESGVMATNTTIDGYIIGSGGHASKEQLQNGWVKTEEDYYYYKNGVLQKGWYKEGNVTYYLDVETGKMKKGWTVIEGRWHYFYANGKMGSGWIHDGYDYYYITTSGAMKTGWFSEGSATYYLEYSGRMSVGWKSINSKWYYFYESGRMATNTEIDGWKLDQNGVGSILPKPNQYENGWHKVEGEYYYYHNDQLQKGWFKEGSTTYYLDVETGRMKKGWIVIEGRWHYFYANGKMGSGWIYDDNDYFYLSSNGSMKTGWYQEYGSWYYFENSGRMKKGWRMIGGSWYYFLESGRMATSMDVEGWRLNASGVGSPLA